MVSDVLKVYCDTLIYSLYISIFGMNVSEPYTSEFSSIVEFSDVCIIICIMSCTSYVHCMRMCTVYGQYVHDRNNTCTPLYRVLQFRVVLLLVVNISTIRRAPKTSQDKEDRSGLDVQQRQHI